MRDWRADYVICEHLAENPNLPTRGRGVRVCCLDCYGIVTGGYGRPLLPRFLYDENLSLQEEGDFCIGKIHGP